MKFSYNWLQSFFDSKLPKPQGLAEILTTHSFEVEGVENRGNDHILEVDILPNRAHDCLSHYGLAREIASVLKIKYQILNTKNDYKIKDKDILKVSIENNDLCSRYTAYTIEGVKIADSPDWIKERLASVEQKPINNAVDVTNYIVWELGQPLHAFDFSKIKNGKMNIRLSKEGEELETLDGVNHKLDNDTIIIEDAEKLIDLAGIKGGVNTQIDKNTRTVILQAAIFDPTHVRHASQYLGVRTDAAVRYMHGFDPELPPQALDRAVELLEETNPELKVVQKIDIYPNLQGYRKIQLETSYVNSLLGLNLAREEIVQILRRIDCVVEMPVTGYSLLVTVPSYRLDINIREDLTEEIGRFYGYENIKEESPRGILVTPRRNDRIFWRNKARQIMTGFGFSETYNYSLTPNYNLKLEDTGYDRVELSNPVSDEFKYFRIFLLPSILSNISKNSKHFGSIKIFETGNVFYVEKGEIGNGENICVCLYNSSSKNESALFYELKGYVDEFLNKFGITDFYYDSAFSKEDEINAQFLHPARRANIFIDNKFAGFMGEVHPRISESFKIKGRVYAAELDFDRIFESAEEEHIYQKPSKYPEVVRDISLLVPRETTVEEVSNTIEAAGGPLLRDTDLFDIYEGENLRDEMKNLAFHLIFQSDERTLTSEEVDGVMNKIVKILGERDWEVR